MRFLLALVLLLVTSAPAADAAHKPHHRPSSSLSSSDALSASEIRRVHDQVCPGVVEFTDCASLTVLVDDYGYTGWSARTVPSLRTVYYNSTYSLSGSRWSHVVAHEVGGHQDAWNELVFLVSVDQAWVDYYDLEPLAQAWLYRHLGRQFTLSVSREIWFDCVGPVEHGYLAPRYHALYSIPPEVCDDAHTLIDLAVK